MMKSLVVKFALWLKKHWSNSRSLKWALIILFCSISLTLIGVGADKATSSTLFCTSCHEMTPEKYTFMASAHSKQDCISCHTQGTIHDKAALAVQIFKKISNTAMSPMVQSEPIADEVCNKCHDMSNRETTSNGDIIISHETHADREVICVTCHAGTAHGQIAKRGLTSKEQLEEWSEVGGEAAMANSEFTTPKMEACIACHTVRRVTTDCSSCHETGMLPKNHKNEEFKTKSHGALAKEDLESCDRCHKYALNKGVKFFDSAKKARNYLETNLPASETVQTSDYIRENTLCSSCHSKKPASHESDFVMSHGSVAKLDQTQCMSCHEYQRKSKNPVTSTTCGSCHPASHKNSTWKTQHPKTKFPPTKLGEECYSCHVKETCQSCHRPAN